jgi:hypothetical protein
MRKKNKMDGSRPFVLRLTHSALRTPHSAFLLAYSTLALAFTWPLVTMRDTVMGDGKDDWQEVWEMWWMDRALRAGSTPYHFSTLYAPGGATNFLHSLNPIEILISLPVVWTLGPIAADNVACWLAIIVTAMGGYLLGRDVTGSHAAGFVAGLALGFAPHQMAQLLGHMDVASIQFFVLGVWCLYRSFGTPGTKGVVWALWGAVGVAASALSHPYSFISAVIVMLFMGVCWTVTRAGSGPAWQPLAKSLLAVGVGVAVVGPFLAAQARQTSGPDAPRRRELTPESVRAEREYYSADLLAYVVPSPFHPIWGKSSLQTMKPITGGLSEQVVFPGFTVIALALVGVLSPRTRRKAFFWLLLVLLGLAMSFGPSLHIAGTRTDFELPLQALFYALPGTEFVRVPARFSIILLLGLSVCAALGAHALWSSRIVGRRLRYLLVAGFPLLIMFEFFSAPYPTSTLKVEAWWDKVPVDRANYAAVLEVPFDRAEAGPLKWQLVSGLPLAGGYLSRQPVYPLSSGVPPFTDFGLNRYYEPPLFDRAKETRCAPLPGEATYPDVMRLAKVRYIVLHLNQLAPDDPRIAMAARVVARPPVYTSPTLTVYDTGGGEPSAGLFGTVEDTEDWYPPEGGSYRWATRSLARLQVWSGSEQDVNLRFKLTSFPDSRTVTVSLGDKVLARESVPPEGRVFDLNWRAPRGFSTILLSADGPQVRPASIGGGNDKRPLTMSIGECSYATR